MNRELSGTTYNAIVYERLPGEYIRCGTVMSLWLYVPTGVCVNKCRVQECSGSVNEQNHAINPSFTEIFQNFCVKGAL